MNWGLPPKILFEFFRNKIKTLNKIVTSNTMIEGIKTSSENFIGKILSNFWFDNLKILFGKVHILNEKNSFEIVLVNEIFFDEKIYCMLILNFK